METPVFSYKSRVYEGICTVNEPFFCQNYLRPVLGRSFFFDFGDDEQSSVLAKKLACLSAGAPVPLDTPIGKDYALGFTKRLYLLTYLKLRTIVFSRR